jgi:hypothetical protein
MNANGGRTSVLPPLSFAQPKSCHLERSPPQRTSLRYDIIIGVLSF